MEILRSSILIPTEYQECRAYWEWAQYHPILMIYLIKHVNEGKRSPEYGMMCKRIGLRKGLPDYQLAYPNKKWHGMWLEMKRSTEKGKKPPAEQKKWLNNLLLAGYYANFAYGYDDAVTQTLAYLEDVI
jgi:hypothetical protein